MSSSRLAVSQSEYLAERVTQAMNAEYLTRR